MKKFFSLICAIAIVLSASALPTKALQSGKISKDRLAKMQVEKAPVKPTTAAKFAPGMIKKAPAAKMATYNVAIAEYDAEFYEEDNDWYFEMYDADGEYAFSVDVVLPEGETEITLGQTYTNMLLDYTRAYQYDAEEEDMVLIDYATAASFKETVDAEGLVRIEVSMTLENGDVYNLVYQEEPLPVATDTISVVFAAEDVELVDYTATGGIFQFAGENANGAVYAAFYGNQIAGTYTVDQLYLGYTGIYLYGATDTTYVKVLAGDAVVTFANDTFHLDAYYLGQDAHCYHVQMAYYEEPFVPTGDTINVAITEPMTYSYYASQGDWYIRGENVDYAVKIDVVNNDSTSPVGIYATADALASYTYVTEKATSAKLTLMDLEAVITEANNRIDVVADMLCSDGNVYHITMFYAIPEAQNFDTIVATNMEIEELTIYGYVLGYTISASDENYEVSLSIDSDADGTYKASGSVTEIATGVSSKVYSGSIVLATAGDGARSATGAVLCMNNTQYMLNLSFVIPEPEREENIIASGDLTNYVDNGVWQAVAVNAAGNRAIMLTMNATAIAGSYTQANMYGGKYYNYVVSVNGTDTTYYLALGLEATVTVANEVATITGSMITRQYEGTEVVKFNFTMTCAIEDQKSGIEYDEEDADFNENFAAYDMYDDYLAQYGALIITAENDNDAVMTLLFFLPLGSEGLIDGTYPINDTEEENTVWACTGVDEEGYLDYTYAAYKNNEGYIAQAWFMVDGTVTVKGSKITVNALNSFGRTVKAVLAAPTAIETVKAADDTFAQKFLRNGQLIIIKNGVEYNAIGTIVK